MPMEMVDLLPALSTSVGDDAKTTFGVRSCPFLQSQLGGEQHHAPDQTLVLWPEMGHGHDVLLGNDEEKNVNARLSELRSVEKRIYRLDGEFVLAKDLASTSRREASIDGGVGQKQMSLLGIGGGLRSRQKKEKVIRTRKV